MKYLLIFLFISACGKYQEPGAQDLKDSDGDQILNHIDEDRFMANIASVGEVSATLEFQTGYSDLKSHVYKLSNKKDIEAHSKDLLVKNKFALQGDNFFSEFSQMTIQDYPKDIGQLSTKTRIILNFSKTNSPPKSVYLITGDSKVKLSEWTESMDISLTQNDLEALTQGRSFIWLSYLDSLSLKADEMIKEKSYRVFYNTGGQSEVFYISKELSLDQIAEKFKIKSYKYIDEEDLLTTTLKPEVSEWWIRVLNNDDIVFVHANLRQLSDHYFLGLHKVTGAASRSNGKPYQVFTINKDLNSRVLLKIRSVRKNANFSEKFKDERRRVGGRDNSDKHGCIQHTRYLTPEFLVNFTNDDFQKFVLINGISQEKDARYLVDEEGPFWEIELSNLENINLSLTSLPNEAYAQVGLFKEDQCIGDSRNRTYSNNLQANERSLVLKIEAFIEIIP